MKRLLLTVAALLVGVLPVNAQEFASANFTLKYNLDATTTTYCVLRGNNDVTRPEGDWKVGTSHLKTSGSATAVTENTTDAEPFRDLAVGDVISANGLTRVITAKTDNSNITVDSEVNWAAGFPFTWLDLDCGTTSTDGWMDVSNFTNRTIIFQLEQANVDTNGIDVNWQCKGTYNGAEAVQVFPDNSSGAAVTNFLEGVAASLEGRKAINIPEPWTECRVGLVINTADDGDDTGANAEQITVGFIGERRR